ncbi:MAG: MoaD/ThiS family protein [Deltaproteobacteria bacterium]|nr:MoaD/ThiS family protein [Deltaproteobacteria bacterium]
MAGRQIDWREGMTVSDLLAELKDPHPYAVVRINQQYVTQPNFEHTYVPDESEVYLIPMVAGG